MAQGLSFIFDAQKGETPASIAQKRALVAQIMGSQNAPATLGAGFSALGDGIVANVTGRRADAAQEAGQSQVDAFRQMLTGSYGSPGATATTGAPASVPQGADAASIRQGLIDRGLPEHVADGFLMNFQDESGLNSGINEQNPTVAGSRGGYGLYQLTGPRRVAYEQYAQQRGVDPSDTNAQLDFMMSELQGPEAKAAQSIMAAPDAGSAAAAIARNFLRPAPENLAPRVAKYTAGGGLFEGGMVTRHDTALAGYGVENPDGTLGGRVENKPYSYSVFDPSRAHVASLDQGTGAQDNLQPVAPGELPGSAQPGQFATGPDGNLQQYDNDRKWSPLQVNGAPTQALQAQTADTGLSMQQLMQAAGNPFVMAQYGDVINSMISQQMQTQQQANDPLRQLQIQAAKKSLEAQPKQWQKLDDHTLFDPVSGETKPVEGGSGTPQFEGTGLDAQAWNILQNSDPSSKEYATAYSIIAQPKPQMVPTENGMMLVPVAPQLPAWLVPPGGAAPAKPLAPAQAAPDTLMPNAPQAPIAPQGQSQANPSVFNAPAAPPAPPAGGMAGQGQLIPNTRKPSTEAQQRNEMLGTVLTSDLPSLNANFDALADPKGQILGALGPLGNAWQSEEYQKAANAVSSSIANILYSVSGASANPGETENQIRNLTPAFGDKPGTIADKKRRLNTFVNAVTAASGNPELIAKAREESLRGMGGDTPPTRQDGSPPADVDPAIWAAMTPEERALWP